MKITFTRVLVLSGIAAAVACLLGHPFVAFAFMWTPLALLTTEFLGNLIWR